MNSNLKLYDSQFFTYGCFVNDINSCSLFSFMLTFIQTQILCNFMDLYIYISSSLCYCIHNKQYPQSCLSLSWGWGLQALTASVDLLVEGQSSMNKKLDSLSNRVDAIEQSTKSNAGEISKIKDDYNKFVEVTNEISGPS